MTYLTETFIPYTKVLTPLLLEGLWITIYVSALAFLLSIILGAILAIIQHFRVKILSQLAKVYVSFQGYTAVDSVVSVLLWITNGI